MSQLREQQVQRCPRWKTSNTVGDSRPNRIPTIEYRYLNVEHKAVQISKQFFHRFRLTVTKIRKYERSSCALEKAIGFSSLFFKEHPIIPSANRRCARWLQLRFSLKRQGQGPWIRTGERHLWTKDKWLPQLSTTVMFSTPASGLIESIQGVSLRDSNNFNE